MDVFGSHVADSSTREIVHISARYPPALGGVENVAQALVRQQYKNGMQVRVLTSDQLDKNEMPDEQEVFPVARLKSFSVANTPILPSLPYRLFIMDRESIVHLHIAQAYVPEIVWLCARTRRIPYVAHFHSDVIPSGLAGFLLKPYKKILLRRVLRDASMVIVPTDDYRDLVCSKFGIRFDRVAVVPNGSDHRIVKAPKSLSKTGRESQLIFVGRLALQKNIPLLLRAIAAYQERYDSKIHLTIVGEGDMRPAIEAEIDQLGLGSTVSLPGAFHGAALESMYEVSDLLLLTSIFESFGLVLIEAMTKALPIVSVNIPAVRNVVTSGVNGLLVESAPEAVAEAIHALLADEELYAKISMNNLAKSHDYTWSATARQVSLIYDAVSGRVTRPS